MTKRSWSLQARLLVFLLFINVLLVVFAAMTLWDVLENKQKTSRVIEISACSSEFFSTIEALAFERGRTNGVLAANEPISESNRTFLAERRRLADNSFAAGIARLQQLDPEAATVLQTGYQGLAALRVRADAQVGLNGAQRDQAFREQWLADMTQLLFDIKAVIEELGKEERSLGFFDFYHRFQVRCVEYRLFSGYSASVLNAAVKQNRPLSADEYARFLEAQHKADYIWAGLVSDAADLAMPDVVAKKERVDREYYGVYRPMQEALALNAALPAGADGGGDYLAALSVPAFDALFELIKAADGATKQHVAALEQAAAAQLRRALLALSLLLAFAVVCVGYFRTRLFLPLGRITQALNGIVSGRPLLELQAEAKRHDEIGLLSQGVTLLYASLQETQRLKEENEQLAQRDRLTGIGNRQALEQALPTLIGHAERYEEPLAMVLLDLDHFKRVNDTWGHPVGDEVLIKTAQVVRQAIRSDDRFFRMGGEEFVVLMPQTNAGGAERAAEKMRLALEAVDHPRVGRVTASFGVSERVWGEDFPSWYKRTDEALYQAKEAGRNRVACLVEESISVARVQLLWRKEWESGDPVIDAQHQALFKAAAEFFNLAMQSTPGSKRMLALWQDILAKIKTHFADEEARLRAVAYPDVERHRAIHCGLLAKAATLQQQHAAGQLSPFAFCSYILDEVVTHHLLHDDRAFFPYTRRTSADAAGGCDESVFSD